MCIDDGCWFQMFSEKKQEETNLHEWLPFKFCIKLIQNLTGLFDDSATTVTADAKTHLKFTVKRYKGLLGLLPQYHDFVYCLPTPVWPQGDPAETALYAPQCQQPLKCKGRCIAAVQFPGSSRLFQIILQPVVRGKWQKMRSSIPHQKAIIFLPCFCPFPFFALNSQKSLFSLTFSPTPVPSHDLKWCRSSYAAEHK